MKSFGLIRPESLSAAREQILAAPAERTLRAGGIDLLDRMKSGIDTPTALVELGRVAAERERLHGIHEGEAALEIGALTTLAELAEGLPDAPAWRGLREAAAGAATPGIRNSATVGGNLLQRPRCWYFRHPDLICLKKGGDSCLAVTGDNRYHAILGGGPSFIVHASSLAGPLIALRASALILGSDGKQRELPLEQLFVGPREDATREHVLVPGEILVSLSLPIQPEQRSVYGAVREKQSHDWPLAEASVSLRLEGGTVRDIVVVLGHVAPTPWLASEAMQALEGQKPTPELLASASEAALAKARPLTGNAYKVPLSVGLLREVLHLATEVPLPE